MTVFFCFPLLQWVPNDLVGVFTRETCLTHLKPHWAWCLIYPISVKKWSTKGFLPSVPWEFSSHSLAQDWIWGGSMASLLKSALFRFASLPFAFLCCLLEIWTCLWVNFQNEGELGKHLIITKTWFLISSIPYVNAHSFGFLFNVWHFSLYTSTYLYINYSMQLHTWGETIMGVGNIMLNNHHLKFFPPSIL